MRASGLFALGKAEQVEIVAHGTRLAGSPVGVEASHARQQLLGGSVEHLGRERRRGRAEARAHGIGHGDAHAPLEHRGPDRGRARGRYACPARADLVDRVGDRRANPHCGASVGNPRAGHDAHELVSSAVPGALREPR